MNFDSLIQEIFKSKYNYQEWARLTDPPNKELVIINTHKNEILPKLPNTLFTMGQPIKTYLVDRQNIVEAQPVQVSLRSLDANQSFVFTLHYQANLADNGSHQLVRAVAGTAPPETALSEQLMGWFTQLMRGLPNFIEDYPHEADTIKNHLIQKAYSEWGLNIKLSIVLVSEQTIVDKEVINTEGHPTPTQDFDAWIAYQLQATAVTKESPYYIKAVAQQNTMIPLDSLVQQALAEVTQAYSFVELQGALVTQIRQAVEERLKTRLIPEYGYMVNILKLELKNAPKTFEGNLSFEADHLGYAVGVQFEVEVLLQDQTMSVNQEWVDKILQRLVNEHWKGATYADFMEATPTCQQNQARLQQDLQKLLSPTGCELMQLRWRFELPDQAKVNQEQVSSPHLPVYVKDHTLEVGLAYEAVVQVLPDKDEAFVYQTAQEYLVKQRQEAIEQAIVGVCKDYKLQDLIAPLESGVYDDVVTQLRQVLHVHGRMLLNLNLKLEHPCPNTQEQAPQLNTQLDYSRAEFPAPLSFGVNAQLKLVDFGLYQQQRSNITDLVNWVKARLHQLAQTHFERASYADIVRSFMPSLGYETGAELPNFKQAIQKAIEGQLKTIGYEVSFFNLDIVLSAQATPQPQRSLQVEVPALINNYSGEVWVTCYAVVGTLPPHDPLHVLARVNQGEDEVIEAYIKETLVAMLNTYQLTDLGNRLDTKATAELTEKLNQYLKTCYGQYLLRCRLELKNEVSDFYVPHHLKNVHLPLPLQIHAHLKALSTRADASNIYAFEQVNTQVKQYITELIDQQFSNATYETFQPFEPDTHGGYLKQALSSKLATWGYQMIDFRLDPQLPPIEALQEEELVEETIWVTTQDTNQIALGMYALTQPLPGTKEAYIYKTATNEARKAREALMQDTLSDLVGDYRLQELLDQLDSDLKPRLEQALNMALGGKYGRSLTKLSLTLSQAPEAKVERFEINVPYRGRNFRNALQFRAKIEISPYDVGKVEQARKIYNMANMEGWLSQTLQDAMEAVFFQVRYKDLLLNFEGRQQDSPQYYQGNGLATSPNYRQQVADDFAQRIKRVGYQVSLFSFDVQAPEKDALDDKPLFENTLLTGTSDNHQVKLSYKAVLEPLPEGDPDYHTWIHNQGKSSEIEARIQGKLKLTMAHLKLATIVNTLEASIDKAFIKPINDFLREDYGQFLRSFEVHLLNEVLHLEPTLEFKGNQLPEPVKINAQLRLIQQEDQEDRNWANDKGAWIEEQLKLVLQKHLSEATYLDLARLNDETASFDEKTPIEHTEGYLPKIIRDLRTNTHQLGHQLLALKLQVHLPDIEVFEEETFEENLEVASQDFDEKLEVKYTALLIKEDHAEKKLIYSTSDQLQQKKRQDHIKRIVAAKLRSCSLHALNYELKTTVKDAIIAEANQGLPSLYGRSLLKLHLELVTDTEIAPEIIRTDILNIKTEYQGGDFPRKIEINSRVKMSLNNVGRFKQTENQHHIEDLENLKEWMEKTLKDLIEIHLFKASYIELVQAFDKALPATSGASSIATDLEEQDGEYVATNAAKAKPTIDYSELVINGFKERAKEIGYEVSMLIVTPYFPELYGFDIDPRTKDYSTKNPNISIRLRVILNVRITNLRKITQWAAGQSIDKRILGFVEDIISGIVHGKDPNDCFMKFGECIEEPAITTIKKDLPDKFAIDRESLHVIIKQEDNDLTERFKALSRRTHEINIALPARPNQPQHLDLAYICTYKVVAVHPDHWYVFQNDQKSNIHNKGYNTEEDLKEIAKVFAGVVKSEITNTDKIDLENIAKKGYKAVARATGLLILPMTMRTEYTTKQLTKSEGGSERLIDKFVGYEFEDITGDIEFHQKQKEALQRKYTTLLNDLDADEEEIKKVSKRLDEESNKLKGLLSQPKAHALPTANFDFAEELLEVMNASRQLGSGEKE